MDKKRAKTKEIDEAEAVSANEMTGLISSLPEDAEEEENYFEILHYKTKGKRKKRT